MEMIFPFCQVIILIIYIPVTWEPENTSIIIHYGNELNV